MVIPSTHMYDVKSGISQVSNLFCMLSEMKRVNKHYTLLNKYTWTYNKVRELIALKVLHTSLLNTTVVAFKVLPLGSYAPMPAPSPPYKTILELVLWNDFQSCRCVTQETAIDQQQHRCETLICQRHQTIIRLLSSGATASTQWRVRELYCPTIYSLP